MNISLNQGRIISVFAWVSIMALVLGTLMAGVLYRPPTVEAAQVTNRSISMGSSAADAETTYTVTFTMPASTTAGSFRVEFCDNNPLPGQACVFDAVGDDIPQVDGNAGSIVTLDAASSVTGATAGNCDTLTLAAISAGDNTLDVSCTNPDALGGASSTVTLVFNNVDNPDNTSNSSNNDSFYARIYAYSDTAWTTEVHNGGIALSTAEQLTVVARVQEILQFCVGTDDAATNDDCSDISNSTVDLGVLTNSQVNATPVALVLGGNNKRGLAMVRTNAANGVTIGYIAEQDTGSGRLKVSGATCVDNVSKTDQCINSTGTVSNTIIDQATNASEGEEFGMTISSIDTTNGTTSNLTRDAAYDGNGATGGTCTAADAGTDEPCWAWDDSGSYDQIASSTTVVDDEMLNLDFAATANITTPTGFYQVVATFIATPTF